nr:hypothetical protein [Tanacetum cinerariifolium]
VKTPRCNEDRLELMELTVFLLPSDKKVGVKVNDITRLQALVDKKKVVITEASIRDALRLDDAEGIECLSNKEIFTELARMGYEKPSTKLTFYKAFFSSQWKFLIHTILQCMSAKRTSWNVFSSSMASAVIYLSTGRKFNFSKKQVGDLLTHTTKYTSLVLTQKVAEGDDDEVHVEDVNDDGVATEGVVSAADDIVPTGGIIANIDTDEDVVLEDAKHVAADAKDGQGTDIDESADIQGRTADTTITTADVPIYTATTAAAPTLTAAPSRRRKGVVIKDPQETAPTSSTIIHSEAKSKDKGNIVRLIACKNVLVLVLMEYLLMKHPGQWKLTQEIRLKPQFSEQQLLKLEKQQLMEE